MSDIDDAEVITPAFYTVTLCMIDRCYGGPEEGGWYYDHPTPLTGKDHAAHIRVFTSEEEALAYARTFEPMIANLNRGRRPLWSVMSSGVYGVHVFEGFPSAPPRPHYE